MLGREGAEVMEVYKGGIAVVWGEIEGGQKV